MDALKNTASASGLGERADQVAQDSTPTTDNQAQDTSSAQRAHNSDTIWDPFYADNPVAREDSQDKEYEPSGRLSDEPRRLPATRKEIERRQHLPLSQRSRESTLVPMEEAVDCINKRKRNQGPKSEKSPGTAGKSATGGGDSEVTICAYPPQDLMMNFEEQEVLEDATSMPAQTPALRREKRDMNRPLFGTLNRTPSSAEDDAIIHQSAAKRPRHGGSPQVLNLKTEGRAICAGSRPTSTGGYTNDDLRTGAMAPSLQSGMEVPDSPLFVGEDDLAGTPTGQGDDRSRTYVAPTSPHNHDVGEKDNSELYDVSTRAASILGENSPVLEESVDLGSGFSGHEDVRRDSAGDAISLPPNIWIRAPNRSWVFWDKSSLDAVTLRRMSEEVKSQMGLEHLADLTMKISDRKEKWTIVLGLGEELRHQDIKAMVKADARIRDVYYSPAD